MAVLYRLVEARASGNRNRAIGQCANDVARAGRRSAMPSLTEFENKLLTLDCINTIRSYRA